MEFVFFFSLQIYQSQQCKQTEHEYIIYRKILSFILLLLVFILFFRFFFVYFLNFFACNCSNQIKFSKDISRVEDKPFFRTKSVSNMDAKVSKRLELSFSYADQFRSLINSDCVFRSHTIFSELLMCCFFLNGLMGCIAKDVCFIEFKHSRDLNLYEYYLASLKSSELSSMLILLVYSSNNIVMIMTKICL